MHEALKEYIQAVGAAHAAGNATEHTYRPALQAFLQSLRPSISATNEPKRVACGAPDYVIQRKGLTLGYIEAKDIGKSLDEVEKSEQLKRYLHALGNLILTDYLEFRWYVDGEKRASVKLASIEKGKVHLDSDGSERAVRLLQDFLDHAPASITSPEVLARHMARITDMIRDIIIAAFAHRKASYTILELRNFFNKTLLPGLELEARTGEFADMYAQTIAYGLFAARCNHDGPGETFRRHGAASEIPKTNPLLRTLFESVTGTSLDDEPFAGFVDDLVQLLATTDIDAVLKDFGKRARLHDPVVHFYETFLAEYDPKLREKRGVYYTPSPVVSYIVRSVDKILKQAFDLSDGLADTSSVVIKKKVLSLTAGPVGGSKGMTVQNEEEAGTTVPRVLILDPACGTGTFLYAVVDHIRRSLRDRGQGGVWTGYVREKLLPRIFGFELLMASYAVAHFKLGLQLAGKDLPLDEQKQWAYNFLGDERLNVFLTNTLEQAEERMIASLPGMYQSFTKESLEARKVKLDMPIMVILGNPPYSGHSANASKRKVGKKMVLTFIGKLIEAYKQVDGELLGEKQVKWLHDDYVKFIRWAQWRIEKTGSGVVGFVTNHSYLDNPTFRGMRQSLLNTFSDIRILDLHGNAKKKETALDGSPDKNVFDIQQGVAIVLLTKRLGHEGPAFVYHADLQGERQQKYDWLDAHDLDSTDWTVLKPQTPSYWFVPWNYDLGGEYGTLWRVPDIFPVNSVGIVTARDKLCVGWTKEEIWDRVQDFAALPPEEARNKYELGDDARDWQVKLAQADVIASGPDRKHLAPVLYRPYDVRHTYYTGKTKGFLCMPLREVMQHALDGKNIGLSTPRGTEVQGSWKHIFCSRYIIQHHTVSLKEVNYIFLTYLHKEMLTLKDSKLLVWDKDKQGRIPNLAPAFVEDMQTALGLSFVTTGTGDLQKTFGPEDVFHYIYAMFHCPGYRARYAQFLKADFPRVPLTSNLDLFRTLCGLGKELATLHLLESTTRPSTGYPKPGTDTVDKGFPVYDAVNTLVRINADQYFSGVPATVWEFQVGGYQVAEKWLKDRRGRKLDISDIETYQKIIHALAETIRLMSEIDAAIPGWPLV
ncbi:MAG: N6 adenine-specific DNA [Desulfovibrionaceae bacterium]|nr:MAG: N6 adenine-specific DNA [Desulfovibrionaceae bacterium]